MLICENVRESLELFQDRGYCGDFIIVPYIMCIKLMCFRGLEAKRYVVLIYDIKSKYLAGGVYT